MSQTLLATIQFARGLRANLPSSGLPGQPFFCYDTGELFVFWNGSMVQIAGAGIEYLRSLLDVSIDSPTDGQILAYDSASGKWINATNTSGSLAGDSDVELTSPANGDVLTYMTASSKWENQQPSGGVPAGSNIAYIPAKQSPQLYNFSTSYAGLSLITGFMSYNIINSASKFRVSLSAGSVGTGLKVVRAVMQKWATTSVGTGSITPAFISSTPITWNSGNASPSLVPGDNYSDAITLAISPAYSYQLIVYFDPSTDPTATLWTDNGYSIAGSGQTSASGDWTGDTTDTYGLNISCAYAGQHIFGVARLVTA